ncbi:hypothetical protein VH22019_00077 [Vibrio phage VH2_2019]|nr:hypothetical protein VH22019_00077 [Vibrio phage VH2_2019]
MFKLNPIKEALFEGFFQQIQTIPSGGGDPVPDQLPVSTVHYANHPKSGKGMNWLGGVKIVIGAWASNNNYTPQGIHISNIAHGSGYTHYYTGSATTEVHQDLPDNVGYGTTATKIYSVTQTYEGATAGGTPTMEAIGLKREAITSDTVKQSTVTFDMATATKREFETHTYYSASTAALRDELEKVPDNITADKYGENKGNFWGSVSSPYSSAWVKVVKIEDENFPVENSRVYISNEGNLSLVVPVGTPERELTLGIYSQITRLGFIPSPKAGWSPTVGITSRTRGSASTTILGSTTVTTEAVYRKAYITGNWEYQYTVSESGEHASSSAIRNASKNFLEGKIRSELSGSWFPPKDTPAVRGFIPDPITKEPTEAEYAFGLTGTQLGGIFDSLLSSGLQPYINQSDGSQQTHYVGDGNFAKHYVEDAGGYGRGRVIAGGTAYATVSGSRYRYLNCYSGYKMGYGAPDIRKGANVFKYNNNYSYSALPFSRTFSDYVYDSEGNYLWTAYYSYVKFVPILHEVHGFIGYYIYGKVTNRRYDSSSAPTESFEGLLWEVHFSFAATRTRWEFNSYGYAEVYYTVPKLELVDNVENPFFNVARGVADQEWEIYAFGEAGLTETPEVGKPLYYVTAKVAAAGKDPDTLTPTLEWHPDTVRETPAA